MILNDVFVILGQSVKIDEPKINGIKQYASTQQFQECMENYENK